MNITDAFIDRLYELSCLPLPENIERKAAVALLDLLGVTYGGAYLNGNALDAYINSSGSSTVIGRNTKTNAVSAAFINAFHAHLLELDDGHRFAMMHPGAAVIPAVLAVCEQEKLPFKKLLKGIVIGYEAAVKMAICIQPGHKKLGFHTTGTCGTIGAALGCAAVMDMDKAQMKTVLSAAAAGAAGLLQIQEDVSRLKPYNAANAAASGVQAAMTGRTGLCGPEDILGGDRGFLAIHSADVKAERLYENVPYYEIERIYVKPYAACRHCHPSIEAIMKIKSELNADPADIAEISVETYGLAIRGHDHTEILGTQSAKLSVPYSIAAAYILETGGLDAFSEDAVKNNEILDLAKKVRITEDPEFSAKAPGKRIAKVTAVTFSGETASCRIDDAKGDPENPMTDEEFIKKFKELMTWCCRSEIADELLDLLVRNTGTKGLYEII